MSAEAFPLSWPTRYSRTPSFARQSARFKSTFAASRDALIAELTRMGSTYPLISTNLPLNRGGKPSAQRGYISDPGVAVYFLWKNKQRVLACDKWSHVEDNLRAVGLAVEAMRGLDRWGVSQILERIFEGFVALPPPPGAPSTEHWWDVLGVNKQWTIRDIEDRYRELAMIAHPDRGGSHDQAVRLNRAIADARREKGAS